MKTTVRLSRGELEVVLRSYFGIESADVVFQVEGPPDPPYASRSAPADGVVGVAVTYEASRAEARP